MLGPIFIKFPLSFSRKLDCFDGLGRISMPMVGRLCSCAVVQLCSCASSIFFAGALSRIRPFLGQPRQTQQISDQTHSYADIQPKQIFDTDVALEFIVSRGLDLVLDIHGQGQTKARFVSAKSSVVISLGLLS